MAEQFQQVFFFFVEMGRSGFRLSTGTLSKDKMYDGRCTIRLEFSHTYPSIHSPIHLTGSPAIVMGVGGFLSQHWEKIGVQLQCPYFLIFHIL